jgi:inner membrane protein
MNLNVSMKNSIILKIIAIGFLVLILLIPTTMIRGLIDEREQTRNSAIDEVSSKWGNSQTLVGPVLTIPYKKMVSVAVAAGEKPKMEEEIFYAHFLPDQLQIKGKLEPQMLQRGIYKVVAYNSQTQFSGEFVAPDFKSLDSEVKSVIWADAIISLGIPDMRGIKEGIKIKWDNKTYDAKPGLGTALVASPGSTGEKTVGGSLEQGFVTANDINSGVNAKVALEASTSTPKKYAFAFALNINGSKSLNFLPLGNETNIELTSSWASPSFGGAFLPDERAVSQDGFKAKWKILQLNRNFSQSWVNSAQADMLNSAFGVELLIPVDEYQKNMRSVKYAIMVIALTFLIFFFIEVMNKIRIHPIQYILVGLALVLFFSLLLSLSEHINFNLAYLIASVATVLSIALYSRPIFKNNKLSLLQGGILAVIYIFIFTIIQLQDYALLVGNIGLFVVLIIVMYISRKINWYEIGSKNISDLK